jgi:polysaccharide deacetylase family protein (PEP-CTERM system associated)
MKNALTFDVEDYFHVSAFAGNVDRANWETLPSRVEANTDRILEALEAQGCHGTFFVLGWVGQHFPQIVRKIAAQGHEIACHSNEHRKVFDLSPEEFRADTLKAKQILEDTSGKSVQGYRAPSFSITRRSLWALGILLELGFTYDSSIFPVRHPNYGIPDAPRFPFQIKTASGRITEFPMTTLNWGGKRSPLAGGAYLRFLPYSYTRWGIHYVNQNEAQPVCVYLHPWELDPEQPRVNASATSRLRHYLGLRGTPEKLKRLLADFEFGPVWPLNESGLPLEASLSV